jgi:hypothetical protein
MATHDIESMASEKDSTKKPVNGKTDVEELNTGEQTRLGGFDGFFSRLSKRGGVELRGAIPVPYEERTVTQYINIFSLWFCMSCNPLP